VHGLRLLYTLRDVSCPSEIIPKPLYQIQAYRAGYQSIPIFFFLNLSDYPGALMGASKSPFESQRSK